ncbi:glutaminase family protein [Chryseosolibacter indicus]|uniref:DUF4965 domain-containing protein n=1 Tax=Chryseosolibacter indicus TaxID=2782351 RepID=A0ABS5VK39_9BACT|nr:glutaminase family protein [Chryseosolibacter indicus]MBT1701803.1 DUF4965 domain-containing protein [Chryseosolibacter indicus]
MHFRERKRVIYSILLLTFCFSVARSQQVTLRAPAYPLVTIDPYTSAWAFSDNLYDDVVRHWTGKPHSLIGVIRVDGTSYRFLGKVEPPLSMIAPTAAIEKWSGKYTFEKPEDGWNTLSYNDAKWKTGSAAFGTKDMPYLKTKWETKDIWVRREVSISKENIDDELYIEYSHDDNFELYVNGVKIVDTGFAWKSNVRVLLPEEARKTLRPGKNIIAAHCHNARGGAYVDFGLFKRTPNVELFDKAASQKSVSISATQTFYEFECGDVDLKVKFISPLLPDDLNLLSRPVNYITYEVVSKDNKSHDVEVYFEALPEWAVHSQQQPVEAQQLDAGNLVLLKTGTRAQNILGRKGDDVRIDWGYFYLGGEKSQENTFAIGDYAIRNDFVKNGSVTSNGGGKETPVLSYVQKLGKVDDKSKTGKLLIGYDDLYSIQYFGKNLQAWWKENGKYNITDAFQQALKDYKMVTEKCAVFDNNLLNAATKSGGKEYAALCVLAFRQAIAAHKLVRGKNNEVLFLSKENFSNGSVATVDVTYPSAPLFLIYNPTLLKGMLNPIFYYSESGKWKKPFPAHDVGTYPIANGQTYGEDMPVEESGNMLILTAAIAVAEGNANYASEHWKVLTVWAEYLRSKGFDPGNQLCTDDFAGHIARNANLSVKAILGLASYARVAGMLGKQDVEKEYHALAKEMAEKWINLAKDDDHFSLTFENPGTWSQKYNLVWDKILEYDIFPKSVAQKEIDYYLTKQNKYGLPLDSRRSYTKSDWIIWTATLSDDAKTFEKFISPLYDYVTETPSRGPLSDWHETLDGTVINFRARSVVGGYFIKLLADQPLNKLSVNP